MTEKATPTPMTRDEEIATLAGFIADLAYRCWAQLGMDDAKRIETKALEIAATAHGRARIEKGDVDA